MLCSRQGRNQRQRLSSALMSSEQVRNWKMRCKHLDGVPQRAGAGERAVELDAAAARLARELDARKVLAHANLQIGE